MTARCRTCATRSRRCSRASRATSRTPLVSRSTTRTSSRSSAGADVKDDAAARAVAAGRPGRRQAPRAPAGVARVDVGGLRRARSASTSTRRAARSASASTGDERAARANQDVPVGLLTRRPSDAIVRVEGQVKDPAQFGRHRRRAAATAGGDLADLGTPTSIDGEREETRSRASTASRDHVRGPQAAGREHRRDRQGGSRRRSRSCGRRCPPDVELRVVYADSDWVETRSTA